MFDEAGASDLVDSLEDPVPRWSSWWTFPGFHLGCYRHIGGHPSPDFDSTPSVLPANQPVTCYSCRCRAGAGHKQDAAWHLPAWIQI